MVNQLQLYIHYGMSTVMHRDLITNSSLGIHRGRDWWIFKLLHGVAPLLAMAKVLVRNEAIYGKMVINVAIEDGDRMDKCEIMGIIMAYIIIYIYIHISG